MFYKEIFCDFTYTNKCGTKRTFPFGEGITYPSCLKYIRALIDNDKTLFALSTLGVVYVAPLFNILIHCYIYFAIGEYVNFLSGMMLPFRWLNTVREQKGMFDSVNLLFIVNVIPTFIMRTYCSCLCWSCNVTPQTKSTTIFLRVGSNDFTTSKWQDDAN